MAAITALALGLGAAPAYAATIHVETTVDQPAGDSTDDDTVCSLREAIFSASANTNVNTTECEQGQTSMDTIELDVSPITLTIGGENENSGETGDLDVNTFGTPSGPVTIKGQGAATSTINGGGIDRIFDVFGATITIEDVTLTGGSATDTDPIGGAVRMAVVAGGATNLTINDSILASNSAGKWGGAIAIQPGVSPVPTIDIDDSRFNMNTSSGTTGDGDGGGGAISIPGGTNTTVTVTDTGFSNNSATQYGGAIYQGNNAALDITNSTFGPNNTSAGTLGGGAILTRSAGSDTDLDIDDSYFHTNHANGSGAGGAINFNGDDIRITDTEIDTNTAGGGGGAGVAVGNAADNSFIRSSTLNGNTTSALGGGVFVAFSGSQAMSIVNSTFHNNSASTAGGGIFRNPGTGEVKVVSSTLSDNTAASGEAVRSQGLLSLRNSILTSPTPAGLCSVIGDPTNLTNAGGNTDRGMSCGFAAGDSNVDPLLGGVGHNGGPTVGAPASGAGPAAQTGLKTRLPQAASPVVDRVTNCTDADGIAPLAFDARGFTRPVERDGNMVAECDSGATELQADLDADDREDVRDNCPGVANPGQEDNDNDGLGNVCDPTPNGPPTTTPPPAPSPSAISPPPAVKKCKKGRKLVRRKGKLRCVRKKKRR